MAKIIIVDTPELGGGGVVENSLPKIFVGYNTDTGESLRDGESRDLGSFTRDTSVTFAVYIRNTGRSGTGNSILVIPVNGISLSSGSSGSFIENLPTGSINLIENVDVLKLDLTINTSDLGNKQIGLIIKSSDPAVVTFNFTFFFSIIAPSVGSPSINVIVNNSQLSSSSILSLGPFPLEGINEESFQIINYAVPTLVIPQNGVSITTFGGNESFVTNPSDSSSLSLEFNQSSVFTIRFDTSSVGSKSVVVLISSNDPSRNPFVFTISYTVSKPFNLVVKESLREIDSGETVNIGSFNKKQIINKDITLTNSGISYGVKLLNILAEGDVTLQGVPLLPFVLQPSEANTVKFVAKFGSAVLGKRNGSIKIQWEVTS